MVLNCEDINDCLLKKIVEKCKKELSNTNKFFNSNNYANGIHDMAKWILELINTEKKETNKVKMTLREKLQWVRTCVDNYLSEDIIDEIDPIYYKEWMLNVRKKVLDKIDEGK